MVQRRLTPPSPPPSSPWLPRLTPPHVILPAPLWPLVSCPPLWSVFSAAPPVVWCGVVVGFGYPPLSPLWCDVVWCAVVVVVGGLVVGLGCLSPLVPLWYVGGFWVI